MERRKELFRVVSLLLALCLVLGGFFSLLYDLQVTRYDDFQARMVKAVGRTETVNAARGEITDRYGRPMVTNQVVYQVTLDLSLMGEQRNETLLALMDLARGHGLTWPDGLPLDQEAPYALNWGRVSESGKKNYEKLVKKLDWSYTDGPSLLSQLREQYKLGEDYSDEDARALAGVLYELSLRSQEVTWSEYVFARDVDIDFISAVRERALAGVNISPVTTRRYATTYAAHILGRVRDIDSEEWPDYKAKGYAMNETVGGDGVEKAFESLLRGRAGTQVVERNTKGKIVSQTWKEEPQPGADIALTIDLPLQQKVEDTLAAKLPTLTEDVEGGAAAMIDIHSGAVLALASYPTYDLSTVYTSSELYNAVKQDPLTPFNNRATMGIYPPGSTFKMMVAAAALEEGIITPTTLVRDTGRYTYYKSPQPQCWVYRQYGRTHGNVNVTKAIEVSCNVFFYDTGRRLGIERINQYARRFGLGEPTGIEIPESRGVVAGPEYTEKVLGQIWYDGSTLSASIGQENNQFTPLQLANYTATLANGGKRYKVHLLQSTHPAGTQTGEDYVPQVVEEIELDEKNLNAIKKGMLDLTTTGSLGRYFRNLSFQVGAKTGSAQVANSTSNAVFVCFAPYDDPQVALALVAEKGGSGSDLAGLAADILDFYFSAQSGFSTAVEENTLLR